MPPTSLARGWKSMARGCRALGAGRRWPQPLAPASPMHARPWRALPSARRREFRGTYGLISTGAWYIFRYIPTQPPASRRGSHAEHAHLGRFHARLVGLRRSGLAGIEDIPMKRTAKIFTTGRSQAVRLPLECRFDEKEVYIRRDLATGDVTLSRRPASCAGLFAPDSTTALPPPLTLPAHP